MGNKRNNPDRITLISPISPKSPGIVEGRGAIPSSPGQEQPGDNSQQRANTNDTASSPGLTITALAELPVGTMLDARALAGVLGVTPRTIRRMVARFEIPKGVAIGGRKIWFSDQVLLLIKARAEDAIREVERNRRRMKKAFAI